MDTLSKLRILSDAAKYDAACTSSGTDRAGKKGQLGNAVAAGICHSFTADGRCVSLLKVLQSNACKYDCLYCVNRCSNDVARTTFSPEELADITIQFYRRNYIEGLFLSSAVVKSPDYTMELIIKTVSLLRKHYRFNGYIHAKCIPHADPVLIEQLGQLVDRISVNIELPSELSLNALAPDKTKTSILKPMGYIASRLTETKKDALMLKNAPAFAPSGHATQMIIGATPDTDMQIIRLSEGLYKQFGLRRVFYSAFIPSGAHTDLAIRGPAPLLREHRLYQADWLIRLYGFTANEILDEACPNLNIFFDPKCNWALHHLEQFPVEIMRADKETLLRVPGLGLRSVERILAARRCTSLDFASLKRMGVVLKRAQYFLTCKGKPYMRFPMNTEYIAQNLLAEYRRKPDIRPSVGEQLSLLPTMDPFGLPRLTASEPLETLLSPSLNQTALESMTGEI